VVASDAQMAARSAAERAKLPPRVREGAAVRGRSWHPPEDRE
jgi:hypothetical protein